MSGKMKGIMIGNFEYYTLRQIYNETKEYDEKLLDAPISFIDSDSEEILDFGVMITSAIANMAMSNQSTLVFTLRFVGSAFSMLAKQQRTSKEIDELKEKVEGFFSALKDLKD